MKRLLATGMLLIGPGTAFADEFPSPTQLLMAHNFPEAREAEGGSNGSVEGYLETDFEEQSASGWVRGSSPKGYYGRAEYDGKQGSVSAGAVRAKWGVGASVVYREEGLFGGQRAFVQYTGDSVTAVLEATRASRHAVIGASVYYEGSRGSVGVGYDGESNKAAIGLSLSW